MTNPPPQYLSTDHGTRLAYHHSPCSSAMSSTPGIIFMGGFWSDMEGTKAVFLEEKCRETGIGYTRFDYQAHGQSEGGFMDGTIGLWTKDAIAILDHVAKGQQLLIGSSMGGWIMLLTAISRPDRIAGMVGLAAGADFTEELIWDVLSEEDRALLMKKGVFHLPNDYCNDPNAAEEPYPITRALIEDGRTHRLLNRADGISLTCPARFIHGMKDADVPWQTSTRIAEALHSEDVLVHLLKKGDHRLSSPECLDILWQNVFSLHSTLSA